MLIHKNGYILHIVYRVIDVNICNTFTNSDRRKKAYIIANNRDDSMCCSTHANCTPAISVRSYINYYLGAKQHLASWKKRQTPEWFTYA